MLNWNYTQYVEKVGSRVPSAQRQPNCPSICRYSRGSHQVTQGRSSFSKKTWYVVHQISCIAKSEMIQRETIEPWTENFHDCFGSVLFGHGLLRVRFIFRCFRTPSFHCKSTRSIGNPKSQAKTKYVIACRILVSNHKGRKKLDMYDLRPSCGHLTCHILQSRDSGGGANPGLCSACHLCLFFLFVPVCFPLSQWSWNCDLFIDWKNSGFHTQNCRLCTSCKAWSY